MFQVSRRWLPAERLTTAPEWWGKKTRRLLVLPDVPNFFWRRFKVKFKKRHGVRSSGVSTDLHSQCGEEGTCQ